MRIRRSENLGRITFSLSGRIEEEHLSDLQELLDAEASVAEIALDLKEVKLVDREAISFLAGCGARGIRLENCPSYIRKWIENRERH